MILFCILQIKLCAIQGSQLQSIKIDSLTQAESNFIRSKSGGSELRGRLWGQGGGTGTVGPCHGTAGVDICD